MDELSKKKGCKLKSSKKKYTKLLKNIAGNETVKPVDKLGKHPNIVIGFLFQFTHCIPIVSIY